MISSSCVQKESNGKDNDEMIHLDVKIITSPTTGISSEPYLFDSENEVLLSWIQKEDDSIFSLNYSKTTDTVWSKPEVIAEGSNWFINWADYPVIAENKGNLISHYLQKSAKGKYTYDIKYQIKNKDSAWGSPRPLNEDYTQSEHGFVSIVPYGDNFFATWLDGRSMVDVPKDEMQMTLRAAIIDSSGIKKKDYLLDDRVCDCCQTTAAITENGPVVFYRDRSNEESEVRDISIVRWQDTIWSEPKVVYKDNWKLKGCPVNGPRADALNNSLVVAWFSAAKFKPSVQLSFSSDNGENFDQPIRIDGGSPLGRVDIVLIDEKTAIVSWLETQEDGEYILAMRVNSDGVRSTPVKVASASAERSSGFPQIAYRNKTLYLAWTSVLDKETSVVTAVMPVERFD